MINFKNLSKALKHSKSALFWFRTEEYTYLFTGHFGIRTTKKLNIEKGIFTTLINTFQEIPEIGQGYKLEHQLQGVVLMTDKDVEGFIKLMKIPETELIFTELMHKRNLIDEDVILKSPTDYIFVDRMYMDIIDIPGTKLYGTGPTSAIYARSGDETAMILPVRYVKIPEYLKLIGGTNE